MGAARKSEHIQEWERGVSDSKGTGNRGKRNPRNCYLG